MFGEILVILLLIMANGIFSMAEFAIVSANKVRLQQKAQRGDSGARAALKLANAPNRFLSTIQVGITLIGILAGAFGGATITERIAEYLNQITFIAPHSRGLALAIVVIAITYLTLILGELVPKRLALNYSEKIASILAIPLSNLSIITSPFVWLASAPTDIILFLLGSRKVKEPFITEEDIKLLISQGAQLGEFEKIEQEMVAGVFRLGSLRIEVFMTPRKEVVWLNINDPLEENWLKISSSTSSHFPVCDENLDNVLGAVSVKDLLSEFTTNPNKPINLRRLLKKPSYIPESTLALNVLELFKKTGVHFGFVVDEYGGFEGLVTVKDILEAIVGEIAEEGKLIEPQAIQEEDGSWLLEGMLIIDRFKEIFDIHNWPDEEEKDYYQTVGGFIMNEMGRIPSEGDFFEWRGLKFEIKSMDGNRVDKVRVVVNG
ncbi:MAG: hemolysin family protein [bacterium]